MAAGADWRGAEHQHSNTRYSASRNKKVVTCPVSHYADRAPRVTCHARCQAGPCYTVTPRLGNEQTGTRVYPILSFYRQLGLQARFSLSLSLRLYCITLFTERLRVLNDELQQVRCDAWWEGVGGHWPMYGYDSYLAPESLPPQLAKISAVYHRRLMEILNIVPLATPT